MPQFSKKSLEKLNSCHPDIQKVMHEVIKHFDFTVIYGIRTKEEQNDLHQRGLSKLHYPHSKHNKNPSHAIDIAPYPINWNDTKRFYYLAGWVMGIASSQGVSLRWGGDWDRDTQVLDQTFFDLGHFELYTPAS